MDSFELMGLKNKTKKKRKLIEVVSISDDESPPIGTIQETKGSSLPSSPIVVSDSEECEIVEEAPQEIENRLSTWANRFLKTSRPSCESIQPPDIEPSSNAFLAEFTAEFVSPETRRKKQEEADGDDTINGILPKSPVASAGDKDDRILILLNLSFDVKRSELIETLERLTRKTVCEVQLIYRSDGKGPNGFTGSARVEFESGSDCERSFALLSDDFEHMGRSISIRPFKSPMSSSSKRRSSKDSRYFDISTVIEVCDKKCGKCGQYNHDSDNCRNSNYSQPCYLCGSLKHTYASCPNTMCYDCGSFGHVSSDCPTRSSKRQSSSSNRQWYCVRCGRVGHEQFACPIKFIRQNVETSVRCIICAKFGHFNCRCSKRSRPLPTNIECPNCGLSTHTVDLTSHPDFRSSMPGCRYPSFGTLLRDKQKLYDVVMNRYDDEEEESLSSDFLLKKLRNFERNAVDVDDDSSQHKQSKRRNNASLVNYHNGAADDYPSPQQSKHMKSGFLSSSSSSLMEEIPRSRSRERRRRSASREDNNYRHHNHHHHHHQDEEGSHRRVRY